ncbi:MAG TPA: hypothetical protein VJJ82_05265 [Candidatus Nanoarchaeia archaeon]|nr:hypothetical protein [Candidatus Nanoarchaeia archaeon]
MKFHISRWHFWWGYTVLSFLLIAGMWFNDSARDVQARVFFILAALVFIALELAVRTDQISLDKSGVIVKKKSARWSINYASIKSVEVAQTSAQKVFGCGNATLHIKEGEAVSVRNIEHIAKLKKVLEQ